MTGNEKKPNGQGGQAKLAGRNRIRSSLWQRLVKSHSIDELPEFEPIGGNKTIIAGDLMILNKTFANFETEISVSKIGHRLATIEVTVVNASPDVFPLRVSLVAGKREVAFYPIDACDAFFEYIPFGHYALTFTRHGVLIGRYSFQIQETGNGSQ